MRQTVLYRITTERHGVPLRDAVTTNVPSGVALSVATQLRDVTVSFEGGESRFLRLSPRTTRASVKRLTDLITRLAFARGREGQ